MLKGSISANQAHHEPWFGLILPQRSADLTLLGLAHVTLGTGVAFAPLVSLLALMYGQTP